MWKVVVLGPNSLNPVPYTHAFHVSAALPVLQRFKSEGLAVDVRVPSSEVATRIPQHEL